MTLTAFRTLCNFLVTSTKEVIPLTSPVIEADENNSLNFDLTKIDRDGNMNVVNEHFKFPNALCKTIQSCSNITRQRKGRIRRAF